MLIHSAVITGSVQFNNTDVSGITNVAGFATTSSVDSLVVKTGSYATTGSNQFNGNQSISGSITSNGTITAQTINVQTITSSIDYVTGSSINGSLLSNTHQITGSTSITGSLTVNDSNVILTNQTSSMSVATASYWSGSIINAATASYVQNAISASYALTASYASNVPETASYALQANSASFALTASYISGSGAGVGFPFSGSAIITGSLYVSGSTISGSFVGDGSGITGLTAGGKIHTQTSAASTWTVSHNLGVQYPNVTVYNASNEVIIPQTITATDANTLTLTFGSAVAGYAVSGIGGIINVQGRTTQQYFAAATTWSFAHNLGDRYVSIQAFDDAFEMMIPTTIRLVDYTSSLLLFESASSGYAVATIGGDLPAISSSYAGYTLQVANSAPYSASWVAAANVAVTNAVSSSFAATASSADNLTVRGTLTAQTINVQTITSSIEFITGSTRNGSIAGNTHEFTGSVLVTGSYTQYGNMGIGIAAGTNGAKLISAGPATSFFDAAGTRGISIYPSSAGNIHQITSDYIATSYYSIAITARGTNSDLFISSSGNIGIGTSSPSYPLDVNGIIGAKNIIRLNASSTTSVSTSPTVISTGTNTYGGLAIVWGDTTGGTAFSDLIFYAGGSISILSGINTIGGPAGRTYSMSGGSLRVAMGAGTYTIRYQALLTT